MTDTTDLVRRLREYAGIPSESHRLHSLLDEAADALAAPVPLRVPEMNSAVRAVLKHHKLTVHGDSVVEADLIHAVLGCIAPTLPAALPEGVDEELYRLLEKLGSLEAVDRRLTIAAFRVLVVRWKVAHALGINQSSLYRRLRKYGLIATPDAAKSQKASAVARASHRRKGS